MAPDMFLQKGIHIIYSVDQQGRCKIIFATLLMMAWLFFSKMALFPPGAQRLGLCPQHSAINRLVVESSRGLIEAFSIVGAP